MKKDFAVIGLGRFGGSICKELSKEGMQVLGIDKSEERVNEYKDVVSHAVIADTTDETTLKELGIEEFDHVMVAIGEDIQSSLLTTAILSDMDITKLTVKAQNEYHGKILEKIGVDHIVHPEWDMGKRLAHRLITNNILDYIEISNDHSIVEVKTSQGMVGKSLEEMDIRAKFGCTVVAIKKDETINVSPDASVPLANDDILIVIGADENIDHFEKKLLYTQDKKRK